MVASKPSSERMPEHARPLKQRGSNKKNGAQARELEAMRGWWWFCLGFIEPKTRFSACSTKAEAGALRDFSIWRPLELPLPRCPIIIGRGSDTVLQRLLF